MSGFDNYFHGRFASARAYVLQRLLLSMLALDVWMLMIGHAGRYGTAGFNVAHFRWLDAIIPIPSPELYIGVLLLTGLLSLVVAFTGVRRISGGLLFMLYTYSWSMSMLDSFQHHYFLSLVLGCLVFFPQDAAVDIHPPQPDDKTNVDAEAPAVPAQTTGFGYPLLCVSVAIVYVFTALAKYDPLWLDGSTIQRISSAGEALAGLSELAASLGISQEQFWPLLSASVIPVELLIAAGYLLAVVRDRSDSRFVGIACNLAAFAAFMLHVGAEGMNLEIGWFSYYMLVLAMVCLLPQGAVDGLARAITLPARWLSEATLEEPADEATNTPAVTFGLAFAVAIVVYMAGRMVDLPGALGAATIAGVVLLGVVVLALAREQPLSPRPTIVALGAAAAVMWLAMSYSEVRWDYYRFRGGDLMRRGQSEEALATYLHGERYATWMTCEVAAECDRSARRPGLECRNGMCTDSNGKRIRNSRKYKINKLKQQLGVE